MSTINVPTTAEINSVDVPLVLVMDTDDLAPGPQGDPGTNGTDGTNGQGVPTGGTTHQVLRKIDGTDYNTEWATVTSGGSGYYANVQTVYGAVGDGTTDDTAALQAALDSWLPIYIPAGTYKVTSQLTMTSSTKIIGDGPASLIEGVFSGTPPDAVLALTLGATGYREGLALRDFCIFSSTAPSLKIDVSYSTAFVSNFEFAGVWFRNSRTTAPFHTVEVVNPTNINGLFAGVVRNSIFNGGWKIQRIGDSVWFRNNTFSGKSKGIDVTAVPGATHSVIQQNNFTTEDNAIRLGDDCRGFKILENNIELMGAAYQTILIQGSSGHKVHNPVIKGNTIWGHSSQLGGSCVVQVEQCEYGTFDENQIGGNINGLYVVLSSGTSDFRHGRRNIYYSVTTPYNTAAVGAGLVIENGTN